MTIGHKVPDALCNRITFTAICVKVQLFFPLIYFAKLLLIQKQVQQPPLSSIINTDCAFMTRLSEARLHIKTTNSAVRLGVDLWEIKQPLFYILLVLSRCGSSRIHHACSENRFVNFCSSRHGEHESVPNRCFGRIYFVVN